jgi:ATP-dependent DNA helicase RecQ
VAAPGIEVTLTGALTGTVTGIASDHAVVTLDAGAVVTRVPFGAAVRIAGRTATLVKAAQRRPAASGTGSGRLVDAGDEPDVDDALYEALRSWRARIAAETGVPAYLVFHDRHLRMISGRKPQSLRDLAGCPGVGPTKLERYGDDVLDLVAAHPD